MESEQNFSTLNPHSYPWYVKICILMPFISLIYFCLLELPTLMDIKHHIQLVKYAIYNNSYQNDNHAYNYLITHYDSSQLRLYLAKHHLRMGNRKSYLQALITLNNMALSKSEWNYLVFNLPDYTLKSVEKFFEELV
jgi:hypothetical protein